MKYSFSSRTGLSRVGAWTWWEDSLEQSRAAGRVSMTLGTPCHVTGQDTFSFVMSLDMENRHFSTFCIFCQFCMHGTSNSQSACRTRFWSFYAFCLAWKLYKKGGKFCTNRPFRGFPVYVQCPLFTAGGFLLQYLPIGVISVLLTIYVSIVAAASRFTFWVVSWVL